MLFLGAKGRRKSQSLAVFELPKNFCCKFCCLCLCCRCLVLIVLSFMWFVVGCAVCYCCFCLYCLCCCFSSCVASESSTVDRRTFLPPLQCLTSQMSRIILQSISFPLTPPKINDSRRKETFWALSGPLCSCCCFCCFHCCCLCVFALC